jgi:hypothetical protein
MYHKSLAWLISSIAIVTVFTSTETLAADWGGVKGRVIVEGTPPKPGPLLVTKDQFCIDKNPMNEALVVGEDGALANLLVYLRVNRGEKVDAHPDYEAELKKPVVLDNQGCHFVPHITLVRASQPIVLKNSDPVGHNTNVAGIFNQIIPAGGETPTKIARPAAVPIAVTCNIHPFMKGYVFVQEHPYMAVSAEDGKFEIKNVPAGKRAFAFWHEGANFLKDLKIGGGTTDRRGSVELAIKAGETLDLGDIKVPAALLKAR